MKVIPRQSHIDATGASQHVIGCGIGKRTIFDDTDSFSAAQLYLIVID